LAGACASKPTARQSAAQPSATTYKVGATGAALSAAADRPATLARVQREQGVGSRTGAPASSRPSVPTQAAQARAGQAVAARAAVRTPLQSSRLAAVPAGEFGSAQPPVNLETLTVADQPAGSAPREESPPAAADPALAGASLRTALYVLAALALLGVLALGPTALTAQMRSRRRAREAMTASGDLAVANDWSPPSRPVTGRVGMDPPPPQVTILSAASR
jgi:hypothetical protein